MTLEVLVAAMEENPIELLEKMRIGSDVTIVNQGSSFAYTQFTHHGHNVRILQMAEQGVGLSRNTALMRAQGDISLFSDADIVYEQGYQEKVLQAFNDYPTADIILFYFEVSPERRTYTIEKMGRVSWFNCGRYPAYSIAVRTDVLRKKNVTFSLLFGGGCKYSAGEDSLFLRDCLRNKMNIIKVPICLGAETPGDSTWFQGFTEKFFFDRGVLYYHLYGKLRWLMGARFILAKRKEMCQAISCAKAWNIMRAGMKEASK